VAGGADRIAVIDCETTGVYNSDRIVELAIVSVDLDANIIDTWDTLVQPRRDVGATHIHGLTTAALEDAPTFADIAGDVAVRLHGACLAAHNLSFDARMVTNEFGRLDTEFTMIAGIDTLRATGCRLGVACDRHGVQLTRAHTAVADASATAELLLRVAAQCEPGAPVAAPVGQLRFGRVLRRSDTAWVEIPDPPYVAALAATLELAGLEADMIAYLELVERAVADLHLDADERSQLAEFAAAVGLTDAQRAQAHRRFVNDLIDAALEDEVVTDTELDALLRVSAALDVEASRVAERTRSTTTSAVHITLEPGRTVVFTGDDPDHPRDTLVAHAQHLGLKVASGVTKSTDLVVAHDIASNSGKAAKARSYGTPIVSTTAFAAAQAGAVLDAASSTVAARKVVTCPDCHATWTVPTRSGERTMKRCPECTALAARRTTQAPRVPAAPVLEELTCTSCGQHWTRQRARGSKPQQCRACSQARFH
jgi:DNA polymerase-3 subunit epsilon